MEDNIYPPLKLPNSCKHISYIINKAITQVLQLNHLDVIYNDKNQCYIPGCQKSDINNLKTFILMGYPPRKTYYPINYIGIGLYPVKSSLTQDWYTAYVPLNKSCFNKDLYSLKRCILKVIGNSKLWLRSQYNYKEPAEDESVDTVETTDSPQELNFTQDTYTQNQSDSSNVFRFPMESKGPKDSKEFIFATPSCMYATKPELATPFEFEELDVKLQILIQVKVRPDSFVQSQNSIPLNEVFDSCFPNSGILSTNISSEIEWYLRSEDDVLADRLLFKIVPKNDKKDDGSPKESKVEKREEPRKVTLMAPNLTLDATLSSDPGFAEVKCLYKFEKAEEGVVFDQDKNLLIKLKWTEKQNKVIYYLKTLVTNKKLTWEGETKVWKAQSVFMYEVVRLSVHLSLKVDCKVLFDTWKWLLDASVRSLPKNFDATSFTKWLSEYPIYSFQRIVLDFTKDPLMLDVIPYNKEVINAIKETSSGKNTYTWDKELMMWRCASPAQVVSDLLSIIPSLRESSQEEQRFLESKGVFIAAIKSQESKSKRKKEPEKYILHKRRRRTESEEEREEDLESKLIITVAGSEPHVIRLIEKVKSVVEKVAPPSSSISTKGKVIMGGVGTGGIEFVEVPNDFETWNRVSMCIVPNEENNKIPIDKYDQNIIASLIGDVFIVKESAIDYLLENFKRWPGPHDSVNYTRWSYIINKSEPKCWGGLDFDGRQSLAQTGLFDDEDFYISGNNQEAQYIRMLIMLGCGNIVNDPKEAEYVIVTDRESQQALDLYKKFGDNDEDQIANTHGARHSTLVTPKYIYDCILEWKLKRPTSGDGHMAFSRE